jgi:hypothetical protein
VFVQRRAHARKRRVLLAAHAELRERELIKLASLAAVISESLRRRGIADSAVGLIAEMGIAIFKSAFERWLDDTDQQDLSRHVRAALDELRAVTADTSRSSARSRITRTSRLKRPGSRHIFPRRSVLRAKSDRPITDRDNALALTGHRSSALPLVTP